MSDELLIGLAGGAIGALLAGLFAQAGRAWVAWGEVTQHESETTALNTQLRIWTDDRTRELAAEMDRRTARLSAQGQLYSGAHGRALAEAKAEALHQYRDQYFRTAHALGSVSMREGAWHVVWRKLRRLPGPLMLASVETEPFLRRWREPVTRHEGEPIPPLDRTARTLEDALAELPTLKLT